MGPVLWWWRWWLGDDGGRQQTTVQGLLDEQRQQTAELMEQLQGRDRELAELRDVSERLERANDEASETRAGLVAQLDQATAEAAELRSTADELERARAEVDRLQARVDELEPQVAEIDGLRQRIAELEDAAARTTARDAEDTTAAGDRAANAADEASDAEPDLDAAAEVLGGNVAMDDLTVVDGVGPKIAGVLTDAGIDSWRTLADTEVDRLREVLAEAGPRYRNRDPSDWPAQGALLADGRWQEFKTRTSG